MHNKLLFITLAVAACAPTSRNEADPVAPTKASATTASHTASAYVIRGEPRANWSPGWSAVRFGDELMLRSPTSAGWYRIALPASRAAGRGQLYAADRLSLTVESGACALREAYPTLPDRIRLEWDGGHFEGCGGPRPPAPAQIAGTTWELVRIGRDAAPATRSPAATVNFGPDGSLGGSLNCNDGGLRRTWTGSGGFAGRAEGFEQTAIGCYDAGETFGRRFWSAMDTARSWRRDGERLFITFADGTEAELRLLLAA
jgi:hypothetical protein